MIIDKIIWIAKYHQEWLLDLIKVIRNYFMEDIELPQSRLDILND